MWTLWHSWTFQPIFEAWERKKSYFLPKQTPQSKSSVALDWSNSVLSSVLKASVPIRKCSINPTRKTERNCTLELCSKHNYEADSGANFKKWLSIGIFWPQSIRMITETWTKTEPACVRDQTIKMDDSSLHDSKNTLSFQEIFHTGCRSYGRRDRHLQAALSHFDSHLQKKNRLQ